MEGTKILGIECGDVLKERKEEAGGETGLNK